MKKEIIIAGIMGIISSPTFAQNFYQCTPCPAGTYAESGQCKSCGAGTFSKGASSSCEACPTGTYSSASASFCAPCQSKPANSHFTSNATTSDSCSWDCDSGFSQSGNRCCEIIYLYEQIKIKNKLTDDYKLVAKLYGNITYTITWNNRSTDQKFIKSKEYYGQNANINNFDSAKIDIIKIPCNTDFDYAGHNYSSDYISKCLNELENCKKSSSIIIESKSC